MISPVRARDLTDDDASDGPSPFELVRVVWRRKVLVILIVVLTTLVAVTLAFRQEKQYQSSASLLFRNPSFASALGGSDVFSQGVDPQRDAQTNVDVVQSPAVAEVARRALRTAESADSLLASVTVSPSEDSDLATVTATRSSPDDAAAVANAFASAYIAYRTATDRAAVAQAETQLRQRLATASDTERPGLESDVRQLELLRTVQTGNAEVVARAQPDSSPTAPNPRRNALLGIIVGVVVGCGLALLIDFLDKRLQNQEDVEGAYPDYPLIGVVPEDRSASRAVIASGPTAEAYRVMREGLRFLDPELPVRCILVTSAYEGEGKSTVARHLSAALAEGGQRVVLVEADMRRPTASRILGLEPGTEGLSDLLVASAQPRLSVKRAPLLDVPLSVLPSGTVPPNPADLLRSSRMASLVDGLLGRFDLVVIDSPPVEPIADTLILLQLDAVDAVVVVGRVGTTRRDRAREARRVIRQSGHRIMGLVVIGPASRSQSSYYDVPGEETTRRRRFRRS